MRFYKCDLHIEFNGILAPGVKGIDALLFAYSRIGRGALEGGAVAFSGDFLADSDTDAAGFVARLMGADDGVIVRKAKGQTELTYNIDGLGPLVLRDSDKTVLDVKKCIGVLIDIAITGVKYEDLPEILESALKAGRGVNSSVRLTTNNRCFDETTGVKNTYNIITDFSESGGILDPIMYNELYYSSTTTVIASAIYGHISSAKRFY